MIATGIGAVFTTAIIARVQVTIGVVIVAAFGAVIVGAVAARQKTYTERKRK